MVDIILHVDLYLRDLLVAMGPWIYVFLFAVIFCETGLVVTPFLPGDSLLFAIGAVAAAQPESLNLGLLSLLLPIAAVAGDAVNYGIGRRLGPKVFQKPSGVFFNKKHLLSTQAFYDRHGGKTIVLARFLPIFRTFAPFVAGIGRMDYGRFSLFNITGGLAWVFSFLLGGYFFGNIPAVKNRFEMVILGIIVVSMIPLIIRLAQSRFRRGIPL